MRYYSVIKERAIMPQKYRENLNAYCLGKLNCKKKPQPLRFQIYNILERAKL